VPPRAGRTALLRQAGQPARSVPSTTPCAPQYNTNRSAAFVCPFRVSARSSLPTRTVHTKAASSHRAGARRGIRYASVTASAYAHAAPSAPLVASWSSIKGRLPIDQLAHRVLSVPPCGRFARLLLPSARSNRRTPPQPSLHALEIHNWNAVFNPTGSRRVPR